MAKKQSGLGKGLSAIFIENDTENKNTTYLKISDIEPNRDQPRRDFDEEALAELADSIAQHGVLQPLLVRPVGTELTDNEVMEIALIENLQREDLSAVEEAQGYKSLMETYNMTQEEIAKSMGKSRSSIANSLRILTLPENVVDMISKGLLSGGHAKALLSLKDDNDIEKVSNLIVEKELSVRETEKFCKALNEDKGKKKSKKKLDRNPFFDEVELSLKQFLGRKVKVINSSKNKGILQIEFYNDEDLAEIARCLEENK